MVTLLAVRFRAAIQEQPFPDVLQNRLPIFTGKKVLESRFNKIADPQACNFIKKRLQYKCFSVNIEKFLRKAFLQNTSGGCFWLLY